MKDRRGKAVFLGKLTNELRHNRSTQHFEPMAAVLQEGLPNNTEWDSRTMAELPRM